VAKWTVFLPGRVRSLGRTLSATSCLACLRETGKNMASDLDLEAFVPTCMVRPKRAKWALSSIVA
jgi:hypothetical protein